MNFVLMGNSFRIFSEMVFVNQLLFSESSFVFLFLMTSKEHLKDTKKKCLALKFLF